ncbi:MAG TPA: 3-phosphoshikimate 1-carboxyvinyltransferase [Pirellulaceae bacterium]|nr:3-phosphoshikimate 1-carboxyvinyltransferase [Pirellulaceae bacterium]
MPAPDSIEITPVTRPVRGRIRPPGSKSITNRALVCAALAEGASTLTGALDSEDTRVMIESLGRLGIRVDVRDSGQMLVVHGCGGKIPAKQADLFVGNSGTTIRFLTALCALGHGTYRLDGIPRMRERPIGDLLDALNQLGADCRGELRTGFPPVIVRAAGLRCPDEGIHVRGDISSQFLSAVLMAGPASETDIEIFVDGTLVSEPYIAMTLRVMEQFGTFVDRLNDDYFHSEGNQRYAGRQYAIEPDASAASYFWAAAAITGGEVTVEGLAKDSLQGDVQFVECLAKMGCSVDYAADEITVSGRARWGIDVDMNAISDTVQTLAVVALFAEGPTTIRNVAHIRHKETDRLGDLARELRQLGAEVNELPDGLRIVPPTEPSHLKAATLETYNDHRMAMSLALAGLRIPGVIITNPECTAKTYPRFFEDLNRLICGRI